MNGYDRALSLSGATVFRSAIIGLVLIASLSARPAAAGISGENIMVIVNADSLASRTIANHYVALRNIPANNVIFLSDIPEGLTIGLEDFKTKILKPLLETIEKRGLVAQTRCVAYSADFPTSVNIRDHYDRLPSAQIKKLIGTLGSITGMTYFYKFVLADREAYLGFGANLYCRGKFDRSFANPFTDEENRALFDEAQKQLEQLQGEAAAKTFQALFEEHPTLAPLAILSARGYASAGQNDQATGMLKLAIKAGWWSAEYLQDDELLKPLLVDAEISRLLSVLSTHTTHVQGPMAFSATKNWTPSGYPVQMNQSGVPFMMSCSLAIVHPIGNTLSQSVAILKRAAAADRTYPDGEFLFAGSNDVRATTRMPGVGDAMLFLQSDGFQTDVFRGALPTKAGNVAGLFVGTATAKFANTAWKLQPGAIAESLTSLGGDFRNRSQTKLTAYLAAGAAISSGTVTEPYSLQHKFPLAMIHGHYASGMTAIESYYLSVASPYQLLIAGDPACQPFAQPPAETVAISLVESEEPKVRFARKAAPESAGASAKPAKRVPTAAIEIYVEGRLVKAMPPAANVEMNITGGLSGVVDVRGVLIGFDASEPRRTFSQQIEIEGELPAPTATVLVGKEQLDRENDDPANDGSDAEPVTIQLDCAGAERIHLTHHSEIVATLDGASGAVQVELSKLGGGPLRLRPVAIFKNKRVFGRTIAE